jgi:hypothetical protein
MASRLVLPVHDILLWLRASFLYEQVEAYLITYVITYAMTSNCHELYPLALLITLSTSCHVMSGG